MCSGLFGRAPASSSGSTSGSERSPPKRLFHPQLQLWSPTKGALWSPFAGMELERVAPPGSMPSLPALPSSRLGREAERGRAEVGRRPLSATRTSTWPRSPTSSAASPATTCTFGIGFVGGDNPMQARPVGERMRGERGTEALVGRGAVGWGAA
jgi:hypothetical protein